MAHSFDPTLLTHAAHPTPARSNHTQTVPGNARVEQGRDAVCLDLDEAVSVVQLRDFREHLLPDLRPEIKLDVVLEQLRIDGTIKGPRWNLFSSDPSKTIVPEPEPNKAPVVVHEDIAFKNIVELSERIVNACIISSGICSHKQLCKLANNPSSMPLCETRHSLRSRPDSYLLLTSSEVFAGSKSKAKWIEVAAPGEFKKNNTEHARLDNRRKILWSLYHIMREDIRRRFVIGYTIEDRMMRLWYCSRSEVLVSTPFDFIANHEMMADFILSMAFAEEHELGWDPTIRRCPLAPSQKDPQYDIIVRDISGSHPVEKTYRTKYLIWNYGADAVRGRGTRVWSVVEVDEQGQEGTRQYALKEVWGDEDREPEGRISQRLRRRVVESGDGGLQHDFDLYVMQVHAYGEVWVDSRVDRTDRFKRCRDGRALPVIDTLGIAVGFRQIDEGNPNEVKLPRRGIPEQGQPTAKAKGQLLTYSHKIHQRTVFKNTGEDIFSASDLRGAFEMILHVVKGLHVLHSVGWIHRDISYGNVLVCGQNAKITDLEYSKELSDDSVHHGLRTGTPYFMSEEVRKLDYIFKPTPDDDSNSDSDADEGDSARPTAVQNASSKDERVSSAVSSKAAAADPHNKALATSTFPSRTKTTRKQLKFRHNPLHDMESVLWLSLFVLLIAEYENGERGPDGERLYDSETFKRFLEAQQDFAWALFHSDETRLYVMLTGGVLAAPPPDLHPTVQKVLSELCKMRTTLARAYRKVEKNIRQKGYEELSPISWTEIDKKLMTRLQKIIAILEKEPLTFVEDPEKRKQQVRVPKILLNAGRKRGAQDGVADEPREDDDGDSHRHKKIMKTEDGGDVSTSRPLGQLRSLMDHMTAAQEDSE